jgi:hypothetical protein
MSKLNEILSEETYGESFGLSDTLGCYIDFGCDDNEPIVRMSFTKNGQDFGHAFELERKTITDESRLIFYPHVLVKNVKFECNFGQLVSRTSHRSTSTTRPSIRRKVLGQTSSLAIHLCKHCPSTNACARPSRSSTRRTVKSYFCRASPARARQRGRGNTSTNIRRNTSIYSMSNTCSAR